MFRNKTLKVYFQLYVKNTKRICIQIISFKISKFKEGFLIVYLLSLQGLDKRKPSAYKY